MFKFLKALPVYIRLYHNKVEITRLDTNRSITGIANEPFSNERLVLADFEKAEILIREMIKATDEPKRIIRSPLNILMHQMEKCEGGLSSVEKRALIDSAEHCNASFAMVYEGNVKLTNSEALEMLSNAK